MPQYVAYQKNVVYAFIKLSAKSHSFNILCTMDGLSCPTNKEIQKLTHENETLKAENERLKNRLKLVYSTLGKVSKPKHVMQSVKRKIKSAGDLKKKVSTLKQDTKKHSQLTVRTQTQKTKLKQLQGQKNTRKCCQTKKTADFKAECSNCQYQSGN